MTSDVLSLRRLNRTTLRRQLLLDRVDLAAEDAVAHLVAVQAQEVDAPYVGLWTRLAGFAADDLVRLLENRRVVRGQALRGTQHLVTAADYRWLRPLVQPVARRAWRGAFGRSTGGAGEDELAAVALELLSGRTLTRPQLRDRLVERWPEAEPLALTWSVQSLVSVLHPPPSGVWGRRGTVPLVLAEEWIGAPLQEPDPERLVLRYLAAYGPATVRDVQMFSGVTRLAAVAARLRPRLRTWRTEDGVELLDLPDAPVADDDAPAPVRYLPEFDNLVLGHADRRRVMSDEHRRRVCVGSETAPVVLVDGFVAGSWRTAREGDRAVLDVELFGPLPAADEAAVADEGARLLAFVAPDAGDHDVRVHG